MISNRQPGKININYLYIDFTKEMIEKIAIGL